MPEIEMRYFMASAGYIALNGWLKPVSPVTCASVARDVSTRASEHKAIRWSRDPLLI